MATPTRPLFAGTTKYHGLNVNVVTGSNTHKGVSLEVRNGVAKVRKGSRVVDERAGVTKIHAHDAKRVSVTFEDGTVWESAKGSQRCGSCGG